MKRRRFEVASSIQQTVTRELKAIRGFPGHSIPCMSYVDIVPKRAGTILIVYGFYGLSSGT
jgi:hypothetical protein